MSDNTIITEEKKARDPSKNWAAITGFILSLVAYPLLLSLIWGFISWVLAIIFGSIGLSSEYRGLAIAALVISFIPLGLFILSSFGFLGLGFLGAVFS